MRTFLLILPLAILPCFSDAQQSSPETITLSVSSNAKQAVTNADPVADYATLRQREVEFKANFDLLSQLAQEHKNRALETPRDQVTRKQWESELAEELTGKATAMLPLLNKLSQERVAFEHSHPGSVSPGAGNGHNPDETAFVGKVEERLAAVQQEITEALEAGRVYTAQLLTNKNSEDISRTSFLLQTSGEDVKRLRKEEFDLELRKLEFHALSRR